MFCLKSIGTIYPEKVGSNWNKAVCIIGLRSAAEYWPNWCSQNHPTRESAAPEITVHIHRLQAPPPTKAEREPVPVTACASKQYGNYAQRTTARLRKGTGVRSGEALA